VPGLVKVKLKDVPGLTVAELQTLVSLVTVWATVPVFVQVTVSPTLIVRLFGWKAKSTIATLGPVGVGLMVLVGVGVKVGPVVGVRVGVLVMAGVMVGVKVSAMVGVRVGVFVIAGVFVPVGVTVGVNVGPVVGVRVGVLVEPPQVGCAPQDRDPFR
jgi:hypothetical protein